MEDHIELLRELMACHPVSAEVENCNRATDLLERWLAVRGVHTKFEELDGRKILYASTCGDEQPDVLLNTHVDVVPAGDELFEVREKDGWLHGRGTHDCLGHSVLAANVLVRMLGKGAVGVVFSSDEEVGGATTAAMVQRGYTARKLILVIDGKSYAVTIAQKGILTVVLRARGKSYHASEPWKGENAIDRLIQGYSKLPALFPDASAEDAWHDTMVAAVVHGGTASNRVPDLAEMTLNIRYTEADRADEILKQIAETSGLEVEQKFRCLPLFLSEDTPALQHLARAMKESLGHDIVYFRMNGATDARHFAEAGVPVAIIGAPGRDAHGDGEAIELAGWAAYEEMLVQFLGKTFSAECSPPEQRS